MMPVDLLDAVRQRVRARKGLFYAPISIRLAANRAV